jgi:hypothetical protein
MSIEGTLPTNGDVKSGREGRWGLARLGINGLESRVLRHLVCFFVIYYYYTNKKKR